ncbi:MAG: PKD domain-containing protein [Candidatus Thermoplasmatota archaeon]
MRSWALLSSLTILALAFAGCSDGAGDSETSTSSTSSTSSASTVSTTAAPTNSSANVPPTGSLAVSVPGGAAPLNVTFKLEGTDANGDALNWTLSFGDNATAANGTSLPANTTHVYASAGLFNATFTLDDGVNQTSYHALLNVSAEAGAPAALIFTGHVIFPDPVLSTEGECLFALSDQFGIPPGGGYAGDYFAFDALGPGWTFAFDVAGMIAYWGGNAGASGNVPADATGVQACSETAVNTDYTLTFTAP